MIVVCMQKKKTIKMLFLNKNCNRAPDACNCAKENDACMEKNGAVAELVLKHAKVCRRGENDGDKA